METFQSNSLISLQEAGTSISLGTYPGVRSCVWSAFQKKNLDDSTIRIMFSSLAESTRKQYDTSLKYWGNFCKKELQDPFLANENIILRCLTERFSEGASYETLNTLRSSIALINSISLSESVLINRFFKGIFKLRPTTPKYQTTWDIDIVLKMLEKWSSTEKLNLQKLSFKLVMLLAIGSAFKIQSLFLIKFKNIKVTSTGVEIQISDLIKTSRVRVAQPYAFFPYF